MHKKLRFGRDAVGSCLGLCIMRHLTVVLSLHADDTDGVGVRDVTPYDLCCLVVFLGEGPRIVQKSCLLLW